MPFHISRRKFIVQTLAGGAGALAVQNSFAAPQEVDPDFWALYSDSHIAASTAVVWREEPMYDNARRVNREMLGLRRRPCGLIHFGDCAFKKGLAGDYDTFRSTIRPIQDAGIPMHLMVGNHDDRETFWSSLKAETDGPRPVRSRHVAIVEHARVNWFLLDSLDQTDESTGTVGEEQCVWLAKELDARADKPALVCVHHDPLIGAYADKSSGLTDTEALMKVITPRRHVKAIIFGHTHRWKLTMVDDLHLINLPAIGYPSKEGAPTGWVGCWLHDDGMKLVLSSRDKRFKDHFRPIELAWRSM